MFHLNTLSKTPAYRALPRPPVYFTQKYLAERMDTKKFPDGRVINVPSGKKGIFVPKGWASLTESAIIPGDKVLCMQTGERSGVTVYDIDTEAGYQLLVALNPELKDVYTVKTRNGYHLVFQYDPTINTDDHVGNDDIYGPIDTRNDGGFVFAPPTKYTWRGEEVGYEYLGGEVQPFPQCLKDTLGPNGFKQVQKQASSPLSPLSPSSIMSRLDLEDEETTLGTEADYAELYAMISQGGLDVQALQGDFHSWSQVAFGLSNTFPDERGYELLDLFSRRNMDRYNESDNRSRWETMVGQRESATGQRVTKRTLWWLAKQSGYEAETESVFSFTAYPDDETEIVVRKPPAFKVDHTWDNPEKAPELEGDMASVARLMSREPSKQELTWEIIARYKRYLRCSTAKPHATEVFFWHDGMWHTQGHTGLYNAIFLYAFVFRRLADRLRPHVEEGLSKADAKKATHLQSDFDKRCNKFVAMMFDNTYSLFQHVVQSLAEPQFFETLDQNPWLCNFKNCAIDFKTGEVREQQPEDLCSLSTGSNYVRPGSAEDTEEFRALQEEVMRIFTEIIPGTDERRYFLELLAARFVGINRDQHLYFGLGPASNGKSLIISLCSHVFGDYMGNVPKEVLMGHQKAGQASSELANLRGRRIVFASEPGAKDILNESLAKQFTGDDTIVCRHLHCDSFNMKVQFCVLFMTNHLIAIPADGNGIWRRLKVLPFTSLFTDDVVKARATYRQGEVFQIDRDLKQRLPALRDATTTLLVNICLRTKGVVRPCDTVERLSQTYRNSQDMIQRFIDDKIVPKPGNRVRRAVLRVAAKSWVKGGDDSSKLELDSIIDRLQQEPYNYRFDQARKIGEGFEVVSEFAEAPDADTAVLATLSSDEQFLAKFAEAHVVTLKREDYIIQSDVAKFATLNGCTLGNTEIMKSVFKAKYLPLGVIEARRRVPVPDKKTGTSSLHLYVGIKRLFWRADGASPPEDVIAGDLNSSMASDISDVSLEEEDA